MAEIGSLPADSLIVQAKIADAMNAAKADSDGDPRDISAVIRATPPRPRR